MLCPEFRKFAKSRHMKFPLNKQLGLTFNATEIILCTPLLNYYLANGLIISGHVKNCIC
jgi:hypothetical protein